MNHSNLLSGEEYGLKCSHKKSSKKNEGEYSILMTMLSCSLHYPHIHFTPKRAILSFLSGIILFGVALVKGQEVLEDRNEINLQPHIYKRHLKP